MAESRVPPVSRLPTLTEVVSEGTVPLRPEPAAPAPAEPEAFDEARLVADVMVDLQHRIDLMFEFRLREALGPLLARVVDTVIRDAREELAHTLRDVVARAVSQEVARRRVR